MNPCIQGFIALLWTLIKHGTADNLLARLTPVASIRCRFRDAGCLRLRGSAEAPRSAKIYLACPTA